jgi:acetyl-CoA C-acetyltransferase
VPQGIGADLIATLGGWERDDVDRYALTSQQRAAAAQAEGRFDRSVIAVEDELGLAVLERDEFIKPRTTLEGLAQLKLAFDELGAMGFDAVALARYPQVERIHHVHTAGNSSGIVDGAGRRADRQRSEGPRDGPDARAGASSRPRSLGRRSDNHADRPDAGDAQGARKAG